jgi:hypothetical protein
VPTLSSYEYAYLRVAPRVEEGEFVNVGVILFCRTRRYLAAHIVLDAARLTALARDLDLDAVRAHLALIPRICAGEGPIGRLGQAEAFHWLVHPHSTVIQTSEVHAGLCTDPAAALEWLVKKLREKYDNHTDRGN